VFARVETRAGERARNMDKAKSARLSKGYVTVQKGMRDIGRERQI